MTSLSTTRTRGLDRLIRVPDHSGVIPERWHRRASFRVEASTWREDVKRPSADGRTVNPATAQPP